MKSIKDTYINNRAEKLTIQKKMDRGEELKGSELITAEEIQLLSGEDIEGAIRDHKNVRETLGFGSEDLLVEQYCTHYNLDLDEVIAFLNAERDIEELVLEEEEEIGFDQYEKLEVKALKAFEKDFAEQHNGMSNHIQIKQGGKSN